MNFPNFFRAAGWRVGLAVVWISLVVPKGLAAQTDWQSFSAILWHSDLTPKALAALPRIGITAGRVLGLRTRFAAATLRRRVDKFRHAGLDVMVENIATDFYAAYHRWQPDQAVNVAFEALRGRALTDPTDPTIWQRRPSFTNHVALRAIEHRLAAHAAALRAQHVLYLCLGDETGIADLSAAWDFDETPAALRAWHGWLAHRYGSLSALDRAWQTHHASWSAVRPTRTDQALNGSGPVAGWMDFKAWMDVDFAESLRHGAAAIHRADPHARAGIEGAQLPGWGGYDYASLARSVDVMELSTGYPAVLARGFHPDLIMLTTSASADLAEAHRLWRFLLLGGRGVVLWDPEGDIMRPNGVPGPRGVALAPILRDLRSQLGNRLLAARPVIDPVIVVYSQSSFRLRWLFDRRADRSRGVDWTQRSNDTDLADSPWRDALGAVVEGLTHLGLNPTWIDEAALTPARLAGQRAVILPQALALDDRTVAVLRGFVASGGLLLADAEPALYDTLGHERRSAPLAGMGRRLPHFDITNLRSVLPASVRVMAPDGRPRDDISIFRYNGGSLLTVQRDSEAAAESADLVLPAARYAIRLEPTRPTVLSVITHHGVRPLSASITPTY